MRRSCSRAGVYVVRAIGIVSNIAEETAELAYGYPPGVEDAVRDAYVSSSSCHSLRSDDAFFLFVDMCAIQSVTIVTNSQSIRFSLFWSPIGVDRLTKDHGFRKF